MTSVNPPKDDFAVREARLQAANTPPVQAVRPVDAAIPAAPIEPHQEVQPRRTAIRQRAKKDRRQGERRQRQEPVLLDTRNHRERRKSPRRSGDLVDQAQPQRQSESNKRGIDEYI